MMEWVRSHVATLGLTSAEAHKIELSMEEALVNVIQYAYAISTQGSVTLMCHVEPQQSVTFTIVDCGIPFNPLAKAKAVPITHAPTTQALEDRTEGGLGIFLMLRMMDSVQYARRGSYNILILRKALTAKES